jgi:hypothetical protein
MDDSKFADIPNRAVPRTVRREDPTFQSAKATEWIFAGYCERLLDKNEKLQELLHQFVGRFDRPDCWTCLTQGQRILYSLAALDGQVKNGGITQFFWNYPDLIVPASGALVALGYSDLLAAFEKALESLIGKKEAWLELRKQSSSDPASFWEPFQASYNLLELTWFDDAYFEEYGPTLTGLLVEYVKEHKREFIEP